MEIIFKPIHQLTSSLEILINWLASHQLISHLSVYICAWAWPWHSATAHKFPMARPGIAGLAMQENPVEYKFGLPFP